MRLSAYRPTSAPAILILLESSPAEQQGWPGGHMNLYGKLVMQNLCWISPYQDTQKRELRQVRAAVVVSVLLSA
jgi:hypothetical protein